MIKPLMNVLLLTLLVGCPLKEEEEDESDSFTCEVTVKAHNGCCSYHSGFTDCGSGAFTYNQDGKLKCDDGSLSPTCTW